MTVVSSDWDQNEFENAISSIQKYQDIPKADFARLIGVSHNNWVATVSGCQDADYPNASANDSVPVLSEAQRVPLPAELAEQFNHMQVDWKIGIFTEIGRAWLTIDADIFIWKYQTGRDLAYFDQLSESILAVELVRPIPNIFKPQIKYILVVCTSIEVIILGICFANDDMSELTIIPDPLFVVGTEGILFQSITGTADGRIFLAGRDGCLHEVIYSAEKGWFGRRCRRVNLSKSKLNFLLPSVVQNALWEEDPLNHLAYDTKRNLLWSASEKGNLTLYDLGGDGKQSSKVYSLGISSIVSFANKAAPQIDKSCFSPIINISVVDSGSSRVIYLVAISSSGIRLYFTTGSTTRPTTITLAHVRLPPGYTSSTAELKPRKVHTALSTGQVTLLSSEDLADFDYVWSLVSLGGSSNLPEEYAVSKLDGRVWCCASIEDDVDPLVPFDSEGSGLLPTRDVCSIYQKPSEFVLMTAQGTSIFRGLSGAQQLLQILRMSNGMETPELERFMFSRDKDAEGTSCCIQLACDPSIDQQAARWATFAYLRYGGKPKISTSNGQVSFPMSHISCPNVERPNLTGVFSPIPNRNGAPAMPISGEPYHVISTPMPVSRTTGTLPIPNTTQILTARKVQDVENSSKYRGLAKYISRVLRPVWQQPIINKAKSKTQITSRLNCIDLGRVLNSINYLKNWMESNKIGTSPLSTQTSVDVQSFELAQFNSLFQLLKRSQEVISLWQLLTENQISAVTSHLDDDELRELRDYTVRDLVSSQAGIKLCQRLITVLVRCFLDDNASIGTLSDRLRQICPTLFSSDDAVCSKATEILSVARHHTNKMEVRAKCEESLSLFMQIASTVNLNAVSQQFAAVQFWDGIVALTIECADKRDPQGLALHYYKNNEPRDDVIGEANYRDRRQCYQACLLVVKDLVEQAKRTPTSPSLPASPGQKPKTNQTSNIVLAEEARIAAEEMLQCILQSEDELFHVSVYNWLLASDMSDRILKIQSSYLELYLKRITQNIQPENLVAHDLLWRYYKTVSQYGAAARVLLQLAECNTLSMKLTDRLDYLSRAVVAASAILSPTASDEQLHREIQEKVEVGAIQQLIQKALDEKQINDKLLDDNLYDLNHLYQNYATKYDLPEVKLAIVHCAGQYNEQDIQGFWQEIVEKEVLLRNELGLETQFASLRNKIHELGNRYLSSGRYLPVLFLTEFLEKVSCHLGFEQEWVVNTLVDIGIPLIDILDTYDQIYQKRDDFWTTINHPLHLVKMQYVICGLFLDKASIVPSSERRLFIDRCLQIISSLMVNLGAMTSDLVELGDIKRNLKQTQYRLERILQ